MSTTDVAGRALHYERRGTGEPVLLVMGVAATLAYWGEPFLDALAGEGFEAIAYDQRGIGGSTRDRAHFSVADLAGDALGLLDALGLEAAHVVGFSLGGMVAQEIALQHPAAVHRLVLAGTAAGADDSPVIVPATLARLNEAIVSGDPQQALRAGLEANVSPAAAGRPDVQERWMRLVSAQKVPMPTVAAQLEAVARHDATARLEQIAAPTLVLHGAEDRMIEPHRAERLAASIAHAHLELMPGTGHLLFWEQPEPSARLVASWLRGDEPPTAVTTPEESDAVDTR